MSAHTLKGSCRSLGAAVMAEPCFAIEMMARQGKLEGAAEQCASAQHCYETLCTYIQAHWNVRAA